jgi:hypothetical protein
MTQKLDLNSLTKEDRVDVNYKLNQPSFSLQRIQSGDYNVAVAPVGESQISRLASGLSQFSVSLKEYSEAQKELGAKMAAGVDDKDLFEELKKEDPASFLTFQRRKAYRNALYKRSINYDILPALSNDSSELLNLNEFGAETDQFIQKRLDPYLEGKWEEFSEKVGSYAEDPAAQALWIATTSEWRQSMVENYNKGISDFNKGAQKQELGLQLQAIGQRTVDETGNQLVPDFSNVPDILESRDGLLAEDGMNPLERTNLMASEVAAQATALVAAGRVTDADKLISLTEATKINGKPVFKTGNAARQFADVKGRINNATDIEDQRTSSEIRRSFGGKVTTAYEQLHEAVGSIDELDDFTRRTIVEALEMINPQITEEGIEASLKAMFAHPASPSEGFNQALQEQALASGDFGNNLYFDTKNEINRNRALQQNRTIITTSLTDAEKGDYVKEFTAWKKDNPKKSAKQWIVSQDYKIGVFDALRIKDKELSVGNWVIDNTYYQNADDLFATEVNRIEAIVTSGMPTDEGNIIRQTVRNLEGRLLPDILSDAQEYARTLDPNLSVEEQNIKMRTFITEANTKNAERIRDFAEAFKRRGTVLGETPLAVKAQVQAADALVKQKGPNVRYNHLNNSTAKYSEEFVKKEREQMLQEGHNLQLGRSLLERGYQKWDADSWKTLEAVGLTAQDVSLFGTEGELDSVVAEWREVIIKEVSLDELTPEEEAIKDMFNDFGIYDLNTYNVFVAEQRSLLEDND